MSPAGHRMAVQSIEWHSASGQQCGVSGRTQTARISVAETLSRQIASSWWIITLAVCLFLNASEIYAHANTMSSGSDDSSRDTQSSLTSMFPSLLCNCMVITCLHKHQGGRVAVCAHTQVYQTYSAICEADEAIHQHWQPACWPAESLQAKATSSSAAGKWDCLLLNSPVA